MELYFTNPDNINDDDAVFDDFEKRHLLRTMRKKINEEINFTDGTGKLYKGKIVQTAPVLKVKSELVEKFEQSSKSFALGIGFIRHSRMDFIIEKGTELGVNIFYLFASNNSNYYTKNITHWEKIARQAMKQSLRYFLPQIIPCPSIKIFIENLFDTKLKFFGAQDAELNLTTFLNGQKLNKKEKVVFAIGPEGGFDSNETIRLRENNFIPVKLGSHRLRTETAAITAASLINLTRNIN